MLTRKTIYIYRITNLLYCFDDFQEEFDKQKHSPEAVSRNEHDMESDVWYTAFTIWEIFYLGRYLTFSIQRISLGRRRAIG